MSQDRQPPSFPSVGGADSSPETETTIFTPAEPSAAAERPPVESLEAVERVPAERVPAQPVSSGGIGGRYRWAVAGVATLAVVAIIGALVLFSGPQPGTPSVVAHFAPADVSAYFEARLDLPGDQRNQLARFMSHFPGFADQASFELKVDETLNSLIRSSGSGLDWARDIEPWFGGQVAIFSTEPVDAELMSSPPNMTIVLTVTDRAALEALITQKLGAMPTTDEEFNGVTIRTLQDGSDPEMSFAVTDDALIAGTGSGRVKASLDVRAERAAGLADDEFFLLQLGHLHADRLATVYFANQPDDAQPDATAPSIPGSGGLPMNLPASCLSEMGSSGAVRVAAEVRAEGDHLRMTARARPIGPSGPPLPPNEASVLSSSMPADSVAYFEMRQLGTSLSFHLGRLIDCINGIEGGPDLGQLETFLGTAPESYFDFLDDVAVAITVSGNEPSGGLIATVDDEAIARTRLERLLSGVRALAGLGGGISISEVEHAGATLTVIEIETGGLTQGPSPTTPLAITVANGRLYAGMGDFVTRALDRTAADSLAANARFSAALSAGGATSAGIGYFDVAAVRGLVEGMMSAEERQRYETEARPFIEPLSHLAFVARTENDIVVSNVFLYVE